MKPFHKEDLLSLFRQYVGEWWRQPSRKIFEFLREKEIVVTSNCLIENCASVDEIKEIISCLLIKNGRKNYRVMYSSQVVDAFFAQGEDISIRDLIEEALIVVASRYEVENKRRWELLYELAVQRLSERRTLLIMTDHIINSEIDKFKDLSFNIYKMYKRENKKISNKDF